MKILVPVVALRVIALLVAPAMGGDEIPSQRAYYEDAIDEEIIQSCKMASLLTSRSANLRKKGHQEASMAMFLETRRDQLVEKMIEENLKLKTYKVERFLNDRFYCTCYATWTIARNEI